MILHSTRSWLAVVSVTLVLVNGIASVLHWYYFLWWLDMPMHFLGGMFAGLILITIGFRVYQKDFNENSSRALILIALSIFLVGLGWELFEWMVQTLSGTKFITLFDSVSDLFFDCAGGFLVLLLFVRNTDTRV